MSNIHYISNETITWSKIHDILDHGLNLELSEASSEQIVRCREYLNRRLETGEEIIYGINTGFGSLCNNIISHSDLGLLQKNLVMSHACGIGEEVPIEVTRLMIMMGLVIVISQTMSEVILMLMEERHILSPHY